MAEQGIPGTLGADMLARPDTRNLPMVGAGALAPCLLTRACQAIRPGLKRIVVWNRSPDQARRAAASVHGTPAHASDDLQAAVRGATVPHPGAPKPVRGARQRTQSSIASVPLTADKNRS